MKKGLYYNINQRKKKGISRSKKKSTITDKAYANMKAGFPKKVKGGKMIGPSHAKGGIPIEVEGDEYVIKKSSAKKIGYDNLDYMNEYGKIPTVDARKRSKKNA